MSEPSVDELERMRQASHGCTDAMHERFRGVFHAKNGCLACECEKLCSDLDRLRAELALANKREEIAVQNTKLWVNAQNDTQKRLATATQRLETAERALRDIAEHQTTGVYGLAQQALDQMEKVK